MTDSRAGYYHRLADECRLKAGDSRLDYDKVAWLSMATDWDALGSSVDGDRSSVANIKNASEASSPLIALAQAAMLSKHIPEGRKEQDTGR